MPRLPDIDPAQLDADQRRAYDAIASGPRGGVRGPLAVWVRRPELADKAQALGRYARYDSSLSTALTELAVLIVARIWSSEYEWRAHKKIALEAGVDAAVIEDIRCHRTPRFGSDEERVVYDVAMMLHRERFLPQSLYDRALEALGLARTIDLVAVLGYFTLISMTINVFEVSHADGTPNELQPPA